jgi:hypothetical protein
MERKYENEILGIDKRIREWKIGWKNKKRIYFRNIFILRRKIRNKQIEW